VDRECRRQSSGCALQCYDRAGKSAKRCKITEQLSEELRASYSTAVVAFLTVSALVFTLLQVEDIMSHVNGLLMPGGVVDLTLGARYAIQRVKELNDAGTHFPLWGTCLGFEWIVMATAGSDAAILDGFDSENITYPIGYTAAASTSRFCVLTVILLHLCNNCMIYDASIDEALMSYTHQ
jgi:hypothetical protein